MKRWCRFWHCCLLTYELLSKSAASYFSLLKIQIHPNKLSLHDRVHSFCTETCATYEICILLRPFRNVIVTIGFLIDKLDNFSKLSKTFWEKVITTVCRCIWKQHNSNSVGNSMHWNKTLSSATKIPKRRHDCWISAGYLTCLRLSPAVAQQSRQKCKKHQRIVRIAKRFTDSTICHRCKE